MERKREMVKKLVIWVLLGVLLFSTFPSVQAAPRAAIAEGIDVSEFQGEIDWETVAEHVDFVIIRCGFGQDRTSQDDEYWFRNVEACTRLGIPFGVYLYSYAVSDENARSEAAHTLRLLKGYYPTLPVFLDVEDKSIIEACTNEEILRHVRIFCEIIAEAGYTPGVYSNAEFWDDYMPSSEYNKWERWVAQWNNPPHEDRPHCAWQYTNEGKVPGIDGYVDRDYWYGPQLTPECTHDYSSVITKQPTCKDEGITKYTCSNCGKSYEESISVTEHSFTDPEVVKEPTCTKEGIKKYICATCAKSYEEVIPAKGHSFKETVVPPTENQGGFTLYKCDCGYSYTDQETPCLAHVPDSGTITKMPTEKESGERVYTCKNCGAFLSRESLPSVKEHEKHCPSADFVDVPPYMHWAHEGIDLGLVDGLFKGMDETHFEPNIAMTRAMLVTVLWRFHDCPEATKLSDFTDVAPDAWYAEAVAWAQERGLVNGIGDGLFNPMGEITREQLVTILYRDREPASWYTVPEGVLNAFPDEDAVSDYAREALAWAVYRDFLIGTRENGQVYLDPQGIATRAQAATILRRLPR